MTRRRPSPPLHFLPPGAARPGAAGGRPCGWSGRESAAGRASGKQQPGSERASDKRPLSLAALTTTPLTPTLKRSTCWGEGTAQWRRRLLTVGREGKGAQLSSPQLLAPPEPQTSRFSRCRGAENPGLLHGPEHTDPDLDLGSSVLLGLHLQACNPGIPSPQDQPPQWK